VLIVGFNKTAAEVRERGRESPSPKDAPGARA
jgi:hypothetical protein